MVAQYIAMLSLMDLSKAEESNQEERVGMYLWEHEGTDMTGARETMTMAAQAEKDEMED